MLSLKNSRKKRNLMMSSEKLFLIAVITILAGFCVYAATRCNKWVGSDEVYGKLCINHGFGAKADNCVVCGKWVGSAKIYAKLCAEHGFGNKKDECTVCGKWIGDSTTPAKLCNNCGFGIKADNCARMK
jgi:hypothetical protein